MFRYATKKDRMLYIIGLLAAVATGLTTPANSLIFGNLADVSIFIYLKSFHIYMFYLRLSQSSSDWLTETYLLCLHPIDG